MPTHIHSSVQLLVDDSERVVGYIDRNGIERGFDGGAIAPGATPDPSAGAGGVAAIANGTSTDAGSLTGPEIIPLSRGNGLLQTTLTKIAQWVIQTYQGFTQSGTGAVAIAVQDELRARGVRPEQFGAVGDGVTDDSAAFVKAASTGKTIVCDAKTYLLNAGFTLAVAGQRCIGQGMNTLLKFAGSFDCITIATSGGTGGGIENLKIDASGMTGGYTLSVNWATRLLFKNVRGVTGFNGIHLVQFNTVRFEGCNFEGYRGTKLLYADGTAQRSDILHIDGLTLKGDGVANPDGFVVDGYVNTIQVKGMIGLSLGRFILHTNTAATTVGNFARYWDVEGDLTNNAEQVRLEVGVDIHFTDPYLHGSKTADGMYIASGVDTVSIKGGKITGNYMRGVNNNGSRVKLIGTLVGGNSQAGSAQYSGVYCGPTAIKFSAAACETGLNTGATKMQKYGFEADAGAVDCNWIGGSLKDNVTGEWVDNSGGVYGNVNVFGYSGTSAPSTDSYSAQVPASGSTVTIANNQPTLIISSGSTTASLTVVMPPNPRDGQKVFIGTKSAITTFTLNGNTGQTMNSAPTTLAAGEGHCWVWRNSSSNWYRLF